MPGKWQTKFINLWQHSNWVEATRNPRIAGTNVKPTVKAPHIGFGLSLRKMYILQYLMTFYNLNEKVVITRWSVHELRYSQRLRRTLKELYLKKVPIQLSGKESPMWSSFGWKVVSIEEKILNWTNFELPMVSLYQYRNHFPTMCLLLDFCL